MTIAITSILTILFYSGGAYTQWQALRPTYKAQTPTKRLWLQLSVFSGIVAQTCNLYAMITISNHQSLDMYILLSLSSWIVILILLISSFQKPVENLFIVLLPLAMISVICSVLLKAPLQTSIPFKTGTLIHVIVSILSYSTLTIAAFQALILYWQEYRLKKHNPAAICRALPPLETMEKLLFEFVWAGLILLTLSLISGFIYINNMFTEQTALKTLLSVLAWLLFSLLLFGHHIWNWRGNIAIKWTLAGFTCLVLAYFGSRFTFSVIMPHTQVN